jgi:hypothetical protein
MYWDSDRIHINDVKSTDWSQLDVDGTVVFTRPDGLTLTVEPIYDPDRRAELEYYRQGIKDGSIDAILRVFLDNGVKFIRGVPIEDVVVY